ncbi:C40 family peptidase [Streptosporangium amethystogenes]|uniref:C40 family peptidase n=1 Tax=Streptosporangium amethystogenes TaxID=2002 RepID=UPI00068A4317|nr:C40 family peptidase [Streptosporangium amethystogenes]
MITALVTVSILSATLAGSLQFPAPRLSPEACDIWAGLLSTAAPHWLPEEIRTVLTSACEVRRPVPPDTGTLGDRSVSALSGALLPSTDGDRPTTFSDPDDNRPVDPSDEDGEWAGAPHSPDNGPMAHSQGSQGSQGEHDERPGSDSSQGGDRSRRVRRLVTPPGSSARAAVGPLAGASVDPLVGSSSASVPSAKRRAPRASSRPESSRALTERSQRSPRGRKTSSGGRAASSPGRKAPSRGRAAVSRGRGAPSRGQIAAVAALRQVGRPYVWGGGSKAGPTGGGFDCSGLALHAWSRAGTRLAHYTGTQFRQGRRVPFSQLRPGDLIFFGGGVKDPTHVGVYVGDGVMVHAPGAGDVVRTTDFAASAYYLSRYRGAVRPSASRAAG